MDLTREFELPVGLEVEGVAEPIKKGVMRRVKSKDIIALNKDQTLKQLSGQNLDMNKGNPVTLMMATGAFFEMFSILFSRVVTSLEGIETINKKIFQDMYQEDIQHLISIYNDMNGFDKIQGGGKEGLPFAQFPNLSNTSPTP